MRALLLAALVAFAALTVVPTASAWAWPVDGPVLRHFDFGGDAYAGGQHRGVDLGAPAGSAVVAPAAGAVSFAGTVPGGGKVVTIRTADGFSATLVHLGSIGVMRGALVAEGTQVGTIGPSGEPEVDEPYVHFGVRVTAEPEGYLDPLSLLPPRPPASAEPEPGGGAADGPAGAGGEDVQAPAGETAEPVTEPPAGATPDDPSESPPGAGHEPAQPEPVAEAPSLPELPASEPKAPAAVPPAPPEAAPSEPAEVIAVRGRLVVAAGTRLPRETSSEVPASSGGAGMTREGLARGGGARDPRADHRGRSRVAPAPRDVRSEIGRARKVFAPDEASRHRLGTLSPVEEGLIPHREPLVGLSVLLAVCGLAAALRRRRRATLPSPDAEGVARIMSILERTRPAEDPRCGGVAVRERPEAHRARGGVRRPLGHLRPVPPPPGERRPDGERDGRARDAGDGRRRRGGRLAA